MTTDDITALLLLLAEPTRRNALCLLRGGRELCVCELMASLDATQSRMSRHMAALKSAGLVTDRRDAQWVRYRIARNLDPAAARIVEAVLAAAPQPSIRRPNGAARSRRARVTTVTGKRDAI